MRRGFSLCPLCVLFGLCGENVVALHAIDLARLLQKPYWRVEQKTRFLRIAEQRLDALC